MELPPKLDGEEVRKKSALEQKQRRLENEVRKVKRLVEGTFDSDNVKENKRKLREAQKKLKEFIDEYPDILRRDYKREKIYTADEPQQSKFENMALKGYSNAEKTVDISKKSDIIKSLDIDDFEMMSEGKGIDPKAIETISSVIKKYEKSGDIYINDFYFGSLASEKNGTPLLQIEPIADKTLRLNINTDIFSGKTVPEIDEMLKSYDKNLAVSLEEAVIHECGHAKSLKGLKISEIESLYDEIADAEIEGISKIAYNDGAEIEILVSRGSEIPKEAMDFYNKYMRRK